MERLDRLPARRLPGGLTVHQATTFAARLLGLAFLRQPPPDHALLIPRCRSVHTFGMRFPIDVVFFDGHGSIVRVQERVPPGRVLVCRRAYAVLELVSPPSPPAARAAA